MKEFVPRRDVQAISHLNVVVDDIEVASEFYRSVLGFELAANVDGPEDYPGVDLASFARDRGIQLHLFLDRANLHMACWSGIAHAADGQVGFRDVSESKRTRARKSIS